MHALVAEQKYLPTNDARATLDTLTLCYIFSDVGKRKKKIRFGVGIPFHTFIVHTYPDSVPFSFAIVFDLDGNFNFMCWLKFLWLSLCLFFLFPFFASFDFCFLSFRCLDFSSFHFLRAVELTSPFVTLDVVIVV